MTRHTPEDYQRMLLKLQPQGLAWSRRLSSNLAKFWLAEGEGLARVEGEAWRLIDEANPFTTTLAITDWERVTGLPDECGDLSDGLSVRRADVVAKLRAGGSLTKAYYESILRLYGVEVEVQEDFPPFLADISCADDRVYEYPAGARVDPATGEVYYDYFDGWVHVWGVTLRLAWDSWFEADENSANDRLHDWELEAPNLYCRLEKLKPAHTLIIWTYEVYKDGVLYASY